MRWLVLLAFAALGAIGPVIHCANAQQSPEFTAAQLSIANQMLDQQKVQILQFGAQLILLQQENSRLKADLEKATKPPDKKD